MNIFMVKVSTATLMQNLSNACIYPSPANLSITLPFKTHKSIVLTSTHLGLSLLQIHKIEANWTVMRVESSTTVLYNTRLNSSILVCSLVCLLFLLLLSLLLLFRFEKRQSRCFKPWHQNRHYKAVQVYLSVKGVGICISVTVKINVWSSFIKTPSGITAYVYEICIKVLPGQTVFHHVEIRPLRNQTATRWYIKFFMGGILQN